MFSRANRNAIPSDGNGDRGKQDIEQPKPRHEMSRPKYSISNRPKQPSNNAINNAANPRPPRDRVINNAANPRPPSDRVINNAANPRPPSHRVINNAANPRPPSHRGIDNVATPKKQTAFDKPSDFDVGREKPHSERKKPLSFDRDEIIRKMKADGPWMKYKGFSNRNTQTPPINKAIDDEVRRVDVKDEKGKRVQYRPKPPIKRAKDNAARPSAVKDDSIKQIMKNLREREKQTKDKESTPRRSRDVKADRWWKRIVRSM